MRLAELWLCALACAPWCARDTDWRGLWNSGARAEAIDALTAELAQHPRDRHLASALAQCEVAVHRYESALAHMRDLGDEVRALRALALYRTGDYAAAVKQLSPEDLDEALMRIDALETLSRFEEADAALAQARARFPHDDARLLGCEGRRLLRIGLPAEAVAPFRRAVDLDPCDGEALFGLGRALVASGSRTEGLAVLQRHRELTPLLDRFDFASRSVDLAPTHAPNYTALGDAERALGRLARAETAYRTAAQLADCTDLAPNALRHARLLTEDRNDTQTAIEMLVACAQRCPDARLYVRAGDLQRTLSHPGEALELYTRALALRPGDADIEARIAAVQR